MLGRAIIYAVPRVSHAHNVANRRRTLPQRFAVYTLEQIVARIELSMGRATQQQHQDD